MSVSVSVHPAKILWMSEKLCFAESCDNFMLQSVDHLKFNQVQIHLVAVKLIYEGTLWEGCVAFAVPRELCLSGW